MVRLIQSTVPSTIATSRTPPAAMAYAVMRSSPAWSSASSASAWIRAAARPARPGPRCSYVSCHPAVATGSVTGLPDSRLTPSTASSIRVFSAHSFESVTAS